VINPAIRWHNEWGGPSAYVQIDDYDHGLAEQFGDQFKVDWLDRDEAQERLDEDLVRASGWRP
jgi:hypothetical protein